MSDPVKLEHPPYGTHSEVRAEAQQIADRTGHDIGIEKSPYGSGPFRYFSLPAAKSRQGFELRCEVVHCTNLDKCAPGHGPDAT